VKLTHVYASKGPPNFIPQAKDSEGALTTVPNQAQLASLAAAVSQRRKPGQAVAFAMEIWREAARALVRAYEEKSALSYDPSVSEVVEKLLSETKNLPKPAKFPVKLKEFYRSIIAARTEADCAKRMRDYLKYLNGFIENGKPDPTDPSRYLVNGVPFHKTTIEEIKQKDANGGFFTREVWQQFGPNYLKWWSRQRSLQASRAAKSRKRAENSIDRSS
jgi:hypothetical protein